MERGEKNQVNEEDASPSCLTSPGEEGRFCAHTVSWTERAAPPTNVMAKAIRVLRGIFLLLWMKMYSQPPCPANQQRPTLWDIWTERNVESLWNQLFPEAPRIKLPDQTMRKLNLLCTHWIYRFIRLTFPVFVQWVNTGRNNLGRKGTMPERIEEGFQLSELNIKCKLLQ